MEDTNVTLFKSFCLLFLNEFCYEEFFIKFNFFHVPCLKAAISKGLGLGIIAGSFMVKVPQILKILSAKSAQGISLFGTSLEIFAIMAAVSYSFVNRYPFSAFGDGFFLLIQTAIVGSLVLYYGGSPLNAFLYTTSVFCIICTLCSGFIPVKILWLMQASNIPIVFSAKMIQAIANYKNGSTGQISGITMTLLFLGSLARIFTSIQETGDVIIIATYSISTFANAVIVAQILYYWDAAPTKKKD